jgi:8-oxo-dGTP diphosphatase
MYNNGRSVNSALPQIAQALLFDRQGRLLIYLRDNKPDIPFPNHWDLFGGHVERGETPAQALVREVREELGITLRGWRFFRRFDCFAGDAYPNVKHIYWTVISEQLQELSLREGQELAGVTRSAVSGVKFANILGGIVGEFLAAGLWPKPVDNF